MASVTSHTRDLADLIGPQIIWILRHSEYFPWTHDRNAVCSRGPRTRNERQIAGAIGVDDNRAVDCVVRKERELLNGYIE